MVVKSSLVYVFTIFCSPLELAFLLGPMEENSLELVALSFLEGLPMKFIVLETAFVDELFGVESSIIGVGLVVSELSLVEGPVGEDISSFATGFSVIEFPQEKSSIAFVHFSVADGPSALSGKRTT